MESLKVPSLIAGTSGTKGREDPSREVGLMFNSEALLGTFAVPQIGHGSCIAHHGEILQGVFPGPGGFLHRGLVTLPCHKLRSLAIFHSHACKGLSVAPSWRVKALSAARLTLIYLGLPLEGVLTVDAEIPVGWGLGSSTSDVIAAIRAVACAFQRRLAPEVLAEIAVQAEAASDSVMFEDRAILFAQRDGLVLEEFPVGLPGLEVLGVNADLDGGGVDTLLLRAAEYTQWETEAFRPLLGLLRRALHNQDAKLLGRVASASARINQRHLPKPFFDHLEQLADDVGAVGLQVAHSGSVIGILFDSASPDVEERIEEARAKTSEMGFGSSWRFTTRGDELLPQFQGSRS